MLVFCLVLFLILFFYYCLGKVCDCFLFVVVVYLIVCIIYPCRLATYIFSLVAFIRFCIVVRLLFYWCDVGDGLFWCVVLVVAVCDSLGYVISSSPFYVFFFVDWFLC